MGSGLHHGPSMPMWEGAEDFQKAGGTLIHSAKFRKADDYKDQNVVVVGGGESASDIAWLTSKTCTKMTISMRSAPGTLFPHNINGNTADIRDSRLMYSFPRKVWPLVLKGHKLFYENIEHEDNEARQEAFKFAAKMNWENRNCIYTINACKSFGIPKAVCFNKAEIKPMICHFEGRNIHFVDGSVVENVDTVVAATGFKVDIPALKDDELKIKYSHPRHLWNNMVAVDEKEFFVVGFCRPHQINLITCCEMQARTLSQIISGKKSFPSDESMKKDIEYAIEHMSNTFERGYKALVDFVPFNDNMANFIGCAPNLLKLLFTDFPMFVHMVFAPIQPCQYRLVGPGAIPELSRKTIMKSPYYRWPKERIARDFNAVMILLSTSFADVCGVNGKFFHVQGQLRPVFRFFAFVTLSLLAASWYYEMRVVFFPLSALLLTFMLAIRSAMDPESFLKEDGAKSLFSLIKMTQFETK